MVNLKIHRIDKSLDIPCYAKAGDAAFDLRSAEDRIIKPGEKHLIKTGIRMAIPEGYAGLIWDRSGMAAKHGIHCLAGVIDTGFRGEVGVVLKHLGTEPFTIERNMRIAQMLIQPVVSAKIEEVEELDEDNARGAGGFGSSGVK
jgi:dUTP pyrophosphatase